MRPPAPRRGRPPAAEVLTRILRRHCLCGGARGEAACAVCRLPVATLLRFVRLRSGASLMLQRLDRGPRRLPATVALTGRVLDLLDRKGVGIAWLSERLGLSRAAVYYWRSGKCMPNDRTARRMETLVLPRLLAMPDEPEPPPPPPPPPPRPTREEAFWARVRKSRGCWVWTGGRMPTGYGRLKWNGRESYAHRVVLEMRGVAVPPGAQVRHACHTPPCVKPDHLIVLAPGEARRPPRRASR